jgi:CDP-glucose 4,6-dehydratase
MNRGFWKGKRVLVTGNTGFKGSWLTLWLQAVGVEVTGYSLPPPTQPNLFELARVSNGITSILGDVRDFPFLKQVLKEKTPEIVFHLAAQTVVRTSYNDPIETYSTNIMGTVNLLEAIRQLNQPCIVVVVTSDKCYENNGLIWGYRENEPMGGRDPYSSSKGCIELVVEAFRQSYFSDNDSAHSKILLGSGRAGNVIGGGDWTKDQLIADVMRAFLAGQPARIRNPRAVRPWQFVLEPLEGYLSLAEHMWTHGQEFAEGWNFGPFHEDTKSVSWMVGRLVNMWGDSAYWEEDKKVHPHEDKILKLDITKARSRLHWSPRLHLEEALGWTVEWYKAYQKKKDLCNLTLAQIARYESLLAQR